MLTHVIYDLIALRGWTFRHQTEAGCCTRVSLTQKLRTAPDSLFSPFVAIGQLRHRVTGQQSTSVCSTNRPQATSGQTTSNSNWCNSSAGSDLRITSRNVARSDYWHGKLWAGSRLLRICTHGVSVTGHAAHPARRGAVRPVVAVSATCDR